MVDDFDNDRLDTHRVLPVSDYSGTGFGGPCGPLNYKALMVATPLSGCCGVNKGAAKKTARLQASLLRIGPAGAADNQVAAWQQANIR